MAQSKLRIGSGGHVVYSTKMKSGVFVKKHPRRTTHTSFLQSLVTFGSEVKVIMIIVYGRWTTDGERRTAEDGRMTFLIVFLVFLEFVRRLSFVVRHPSYDVNRPLTVHNCIFSSETTEPNLTKFLQEWCMCGPSRVILHKSTTFRFGWTNNMAARAYSLFWLGHFQKSFPLKLLHRIQPNFSETMTCTGGPSQKNIHFVWLNKQHGRQRLFFFFNWPIFKIIASETTGLILSKLETWWTGVLSTKILFFRGLSSPEFVKIVLICPF